MASSPNAARRDDDPPHANLDGIRFQATTDKTGIIAVPLAADTRPPVTFLDVEEAVALAGTIQALIARARIRDAHSYLAAFLEAVLDDMMDAIAACRPETPE